MVQYAAQIQPKPDITYLSIYGSYESRPISILPYIVRVLQPRALQNSGTGVADRFRS